MAPTERRLHPRRTLNVPVRVVHNPSGRTFPCRLAEASAGGARLLAPAAMPVRKGHTLLIEPSEALARELSAGALSAKDPSVREVSDLSGLNLPATVVRVDRERLIVEGQLAIGVRFDRPQPPR